MLGVRSLELEFLLNGAIAMTASARAKRIARPRPAGRMERKPGTARHLEAVDFTGVFRAGASDRVYAIKRGVAADAVVQIAKAMGAPKESLVKTLGLSRATLDRKLRSGRPLSPDEGQRVLGMAKLIGLVQTMVQESGNPEGFDAARWLARWIDEELPAFGGKKPAEFLDTAEGQEMVANMLLRLQSGAYS